MQARPIVLVPLMLAVFAGGGRLHAAIRWEKHDNRETNKGGETAHREEPPLRYCDRFHNAKSYWSQALAQRWDRASAAIA